MTRHKYPRWLGFPSMLVAVGGGLPILIHYFVGGDLLYYVANVIGALSLIYIVLREMLYPWAVGIVEWIKRKK